MQAVQDEHSTVLSLQRHTRYFHAKRAFSVAKKKAHKDHLKEKRSTGHSSHDPAFNKLHNALLFFQAPNALTIARTKATSKTTKHERHPKCAKLLSHEAWLLLLLIYDDVSSSFSDSLSSGGFSKSTDPSGQWQHSSTAALLTTNFAARLAGEKKQDILANAIWIWKQESSLNLSSEDMTMAPYIMTHPKRLPLQVSIHRF